MSEVFEYNFYFSDEKEYKHKPAHQFLFELARDLGLPGCTILKSVESFGKTRKIHAENFFELQGNCEYIAIFILNESQKKVLYDKLKEVKFACYITKSKIEVDAIF